MFFKHQISILEWFLRYRDTEWSNDAENSALPSQEYILKYIQIENSHFNL